MGNPAVMTAMCQCTFGVAPAPLTVTSQMTAFAQNNLMGTIMDMPKPPMTFGLCSCSNNPAVIAATALALRVPLEVAATAAKMGILTPAPCIPACAAPWAPGSPTVIVGGKPALNNSSKCVCSYGGVISITMTPAMTVTIP
ncbi:MAG: DUF4280 domain-containing protein [Oscillospiraceae bacterium]|nr:DUF4280 domain-containing protein [Oscillospiraceae bacterium]